MGLAKNVIPKYTFLLILNLFLFPSSRATQIQIQNRCSYTVWAAANPGGGKQLNQGETWTLTNLTGSGRIWGRTNCNFGSEGRGKCESGDCDGRLECKVKGRAPKTVAEYALNHGGNDLINISVVEGFNIPMEFSQDQGSCRGASKCAADVNDACPMELRDPGGCNNPCTVFNNNQFCCNSDNNICEPTSYSKFFKDLCPYASTYPSEGQRSVCPTGTDYKLVFCPSDNDTAPNTAFFEIENNCSYTVWAAAFPGGGKRLDPKQKWSLAIDMASLKPSGRIWGRTNCSFDDGGRGNCETGDCGGVLECKGYGQPPNTLAEYTLAGINRLDFFDISLVDGFNIPMEFGPAKSESLCSKGISCAHDITVDCPNELRAPGGCNNACTVYKTDQYCCTGANATPTACGPTVFSLFFKDRCPDAYSYAYDDQTATFVCPGGNSYQVVFCP